jgi:hypothetical protein
VTVAAGASPPPRPMGVSRLAEFLAPERNVAAASAAVFLMGLGEELWKRFVPKYLAALGAPAAALCSTREDGSPIDSGADERSRSSSHSRLSVMGCISSLPVGRWFSSALGSSWPGRAPPAPPYSR